MSPQIRITLWFVLSNFTLLFASRIVLNFVYGGETFVILWPSFLGQLLESSGKIEDADGRSSGPVLCAPWERQVHRFLGLGDERDGHEPHGHGCLRSHFHAEPRQHANQTHLRLHHPEPHPCKTPQSSLCVLGLSWCESGLIVWTRTGFFIP